MVNFRSIPIKSILVLIVLLVACDQELVPPDRRQSTEREDLLAGTWIFQSVTIADTTFTRMKPDFEPIIPSGIGPSQPASDLNRRKIEYVHDHSYLIKWEEDAEFNLGTPQLSWQPAVGFWQFNEAGDSLIHGPVQPYQVDYHLISLTENEMVRSYMRVMQATVDTNRWRPGDEVLFTERLIRGE